MNNVGLPEDCSKQWEILLLLLSSEEKKIDRTGDSEVDTMNYFCHNEGVRKILLHWMHQMQATYSRKISESDTALKCDDVSFLWRQRGNDKFRANCVEESYKCYSKSVMYAYHNGPMYSLALANRSAALLRMKKFKDCLSDVALALKNGYPIEQRHKLYLRRADCHMELAQPALAQESLRTAAEHASTLTLSAVHTAEFERHVKLLQLKLDSLAEASPPEELPSPNALAGTNDDFVSASSAVEIRRSESAGRHVVTREPMRRGDVVFSEAPYAWVTLATPEPVCETCCTAQINCVPCTMCSRSLYCGEACRSRALVSFHRYECVGAQASLFHTIGIAHLALRVLLLSAHTGFPRVAHSEPTTAAELFRSYSQVDNIDIYRRETPAFYRMFNLVTNFDKMNNTDYIQYALTATLLTLYLETFTSFFEEMHLCVPHPMPAAQLRLFAAAVVLRSLGQLVCNGHATLGLATIDVTENGTGPTVTEMEIRRATAIYPSAAMMNHSCDPNIINTFYNSRLIIRCSRELPAGCEVVNCYGPHKAREPAAHRRAQLRAQYMFTCACAACNDPLRKDFVLLFSAYACPVCKGPVLSTGRRACCQQCRAELQLERALATLDRAEDMATQAESASTMELRCAGALAALRLRQQIWHRHHASLRAATDRVARLYAELGEFTKCVELIKQNIQSLEYQFGSFSVEVAHELRKLTDVMLERIINSPQNPDYRDWCLETHKIIKKAIQLMELNYGSWESLVKRLLQQENFVKSLLADSRTPNSGDCVHHNLHYNLKI